MKRAAVWYSALGVLLAALCLWAVWRFSQPASAPQAHMPRLGSVVSGQVKAVSIRPASSETIRLERTGDGWRLIGKSPVPARTEAVERLLNDLASMRVIRVVAHTRSHDAELGLDRGVHVSLLGRGDRRLLELTIGKQGSDLISTYVRVDSSPKVIAVGKSLVWQVKRTASAWAAPSADGKVSPASNAAQAEKPASR